MGFSLSKLVGDFTGSNQIQKGVDAQIAYGNKAIDFQKESRDIARADLAPYSDLGKNNIGGLDSLVNDPNAQLKYVQDNPFFKALTDQATNTLFSNQAAKGKVGSGGTADALQNSLLLLGNDLVQQQIGNKQNLVNTGQNAAAGQGNAAINAGNSISDLFTGQGNAIAAGKVAQAGIKQNLLKMGAQSGGAIAACDMRLKENIREVGQLDNGLPLYLFNYKDDPDKKLYINVMAQDVEKVNPNAVIEIDGFKHVKMEEVCQ